MSEDFIPLREFRRTVDEIPVDRDKRLIKAYYLVCGRVNELAMNKQKGDKTTRALGNHSSWELNSYGRGQNYVKVLVLRLPVLKRKGKRGSQIFFKSIGLPVRTILNKDSDEPKIVDFEPWSMDLLRLIRQYGAVKFPLTRRSVHNIIHKHLDFPEGMKGVKNPLRHLRITHLINDYGFTAEETILYSGWSFKKIGGQMDSYAHLNWRLYFPKLLKAF